MSLKLTLPLPIFSPRNPNPNLPSTRYRPPLVIRFSRWNNANARGFEDRRRAQEKIEADISRFRRFDSATRIARVDEEDAADVRGPSESFRSAGTPSVPSRPSIPGRKSKYSKGEVYPYKRVSHVKRTKRERIDAAARNRSQLMGTKAEVKLSENGLSYVVEGAPFEFKYSYTETPKVRPLKLQEAPYAPFGPTTMARPWTGRPPLPESDKKLKEFDSFVLPPPGKKGIKPVQAPGPFREGTGPRYVKTREELLGEPLTEEEVEQLVRGCSKSKRQLNMGRDGLTHNMLDNIHSHWKRQRVCRIRCLGVCTVDMDNVKQQLEERTGGKVIRNRGGVIYLFRGRNYNYRTCPRFPLMLWRPASPVYPRLIKSVPPGLTQDEAIEMRRKGRDLIPICKLGKNGVYCDLVKNVREAFQECDLVKINCQGMNPSDYKKIGAKLQDLVPCVLISFANEHILMWRGLQPSPTLPSLKDYLLEDNQPDVADATGVGKAAEQIKVPSPASTMPLEAVADEPLKRTVPLISEDATDHRSSDEVPCPEIEGTGDANIQMLSSIRDRDVSEVILSEDESEVSIDASLMGTHVSEVTRLERRDETRINASITGTVSEDLRSEDGKEIDFLANIEDGDASEDFQPEVENKINLNAGINDGDVSEGIQLEDENVIYLDSTIRDGDVSELGDDSKITSESMIRQGDVSGYAGLEDEHEGSLIAQKYEDIASSFSEDASIEPETMKSERLGNLESQECNRTSTSSPRPCTEKLLVLLEKAMEDGAALVLEESSVDSDTVFQRAVALSRTAPPNPIFLPRRKRVAVQGTEPEQGDEKDLQLDIPKVELNAKDTGGRPATDRSRNRQQQQGKKQQRRKDRDEIGSWSSSGRESGGSLRIDELAKLLA
ncbi:hypothetical protein MLD38_034950 [Melastoma candidum]|uniref:Uncharacterized protein n=1 Tax=Melastoma candidum TaxID=119954 RepID=A0ACB9MCX7_9MYRT|nr:hypothetical protein MLD38_034950 [Melastoma candidum]